ncbi:MAG: hypothetical protein K0V04_38910 [Deltaproteobacteria bacterium]|nr:hypothetical protein [Deltaproteobacteria bacterium]
MRSTLFFVLLASLACGSDPGQPATSETGTTAPATSNATAVASTGVASTTTAGAESTGSETTTPGFTTVSPTDGETDTQGGNTPVPEEVDYELCELDWGPSAMVTGTTPDGPFEGLYAWFGWLTCNGDGISPTLVLLEDPADLAAAVAVSPSGDAIPTPSVEWYLFGACSPVGGWVGEGNVTVYMRTEGPWHQAGGMIEIFDTHRIFDVVDPNDPPRMHGFISIHDGGWDIEGEFTAAYCGPLSYPLGCE